MSVGRGTRESSRPILGRVGQQLNPFHEANQQVHRQARCGKSSPLRSLFLLYN